MPNRNAKTRKQRRQKLRIKKDILRKALRDAHGKSGSITPNQAKMLYQEVNKLEK